MLVGAARSGRKGLMRRLYSGDIPDGQQILAPRYVGPFVLPPAEFLENRRFYHMIITLGAECDILLFVQSATDRTSVFPPGFATLFNRKVLGVITKAAAPGADTCRAERFLYHAGVRDIRTTNGDADCHILARLRGELFPQQETEQPFSGQQV